jgi:hypothetical protein
VSKAKKTQSKKTVQRVQKTTTAKKTETSRIAPRSNHATEATSAAVMDRRGSQGQERRKDDRRKTASPVPVEQRKLQRRVKVARRRQIDPTTCERDYSIEEVEFMSALDDYKRTSGRMFPTCSEILEVLRKLGYEKRTAEPVQLTVELMTPSSPMTTIDAPSMAL